jgi:hypothetical protein
VGPLKRFFHLTSAFFGLTYQYKTTLWEEVFLCIQHLGIGYADAMLMPTAERRFFLGLLVKTKSEEREMVENMQSSSDGKGTKKTKIGGEALKNKMLRGELPLE